MSFERAIEWLKICCNNHGSLCGGLKNDRQLPNRVLDLGLPGRSSDVFVYETSNEIGCYACLSHCWGKSRPLKTTSETLVQHKQGILWDIIPKTFQDAITFSRRMGIRYLWIDCLCIIQDDEEDWRKESALMADIYQNAVVTIAASAAAGSSDGLFRQTDKEYLPRKLVCLRDRADHEGIYVRTPLQQRKSDLPLLLRGWVFQERLLSTRVLHFTQSELMWECMENTTCECTGGTDSDWFRSIKFHMYHRALLENLPSRHIANIWREIVQDYTQMNLTYERDIYPAISGVAKIMSSIVKSRYIAGLWQSNLIEDLLWSTSRPERVHRPDTWRAPTFSWASVTSSGRGIQYRLMGPMTKMLGLVSELENLNKERVYAKFIRGDCTLVGHDHTGELLAGYIVLEGPLIRGVVKETRDLYDPYDIYVPGQSKLYYWDPCNCVFPDYNWSTEGDSQVKPGSTVYCLKLLSIKAHSWQRQYLMCLILRRVNDVDKSYERIGLLQYREGLEPDIETWFETADVEDNAVVKII